MNGCRVTAPLIVEGVHEIGVAGEALGRRDVFDAVVVPQPVPVPRNVGMPDSAEMPAPVRMTILGATRAVPSCVPFARRLGRTLEVYDPTVERRIDATGRRFGTTLRDDASMSSATGLTGWATTPA